MERVKRLWIRDIVPFKLTSAQLRVPDELSRASSKGEVTKGGLVNWPSWFPVVRLIYVAAPVPRVVLVNLRSLRLYIVHGVTL